MSLKRPLSALLSLALLAATVVTPAAPAAGTPVTAETPYALERQIPATQSPYHFVQPTDIAVTPGHEVLVVDEYYKKVLRYSDGDYVTAYSIAPQGLPAIDIPVRVAAAPDGSFYVFVKDENPTFDFRILHCATDGSVLQSWSGRGTGPGSFDGEVDLDMAVESDGDLVVLDKSGSRVVRFDASGNVIGTLGSPGSGPGQLSSPSALTVDDEGTVWVADAGNTRIQGYRSNGTSASIDTTYPATSVEAYNDYVYYDDPLGTITCVDKFGNRQSSQDKAGGYGIPVTALAIDRAAGGKLYACGGAGWNAGPPLAQVVVFDQTTLTEVKTWRSWADAANPAAPGDVAVSVEGTTYVTIPGEYKFKWYDPAGALLGSIGSEGTGDDQFLDMTAIAVDGSGNVYVGDETKVKVFETGTMNYDGGFELSDPSGNVTDIEVDAEGKRYVADDYNDKIRVYTGLNQTGSWGVAGNGPGQLYGPGSIALDPDGLHIWVSDVYRVSKFTTAGAYTGISVGEHDNSGVWPIAVDGEGRLVVRTEDNELQRYRSDGTRVVDMGSLGFGEEQFADPSGMDFAADGDLYVADTYNNRVQVLGATQDTLPPVTAAEGTGDRWTTGSIGVRLVAVDGCSGVASTRYSLSGATTRAEDDYTGQFEIANEGTTTITFYSIDASGHAEAPKTAYAKRDITPPQVTASIGDGQVVDSSSTTVRLTASDALSGVESITWKLDGGTQKTEAETVVDIPVTGKGRHTIHYKATDAAGNTWPACGDLTFTLRPLVNRPPTTPATSTQLAGADRYATGVEISKAGFPAGASTVVLASGANFPDALGAAALADAYGAPLLLTNPTSLPSAVAGEIQRLGAGNLIVIGGPPAVSDGVMNSAKALLTGAKTASRVSGPDRYATSKAVYDAFRARLAATGQGFSGTVVIASGANFPDALAASPLSAHKRWPILLTQPNVLPSSTLAALNGGGVTKAIVVGGPPAVSEDVVTSLKRKLGDPNVTRLSGPDRYATALAIIARAEAEGLSWDGVCIATGTNFADALAGGPFAARMGTFVALTPPTALNENLRATLAAKKSSIASVRFLGSTAAVSQPVRDAVMNALNR